MDLLLQNLQQRQKTVTVVPAFPGFDPTDYIGRLYTFIAAKFIYQDKIAGTFFTNQQPTRYKQLSNMAAQLSKHKQRKTEVMMENRDMQIWWDFNIRTDRVIKARRPDIAPLITIRKLSSLMWLYPRDFRFSNKEAEKISKYQDLASVISRTWYTKN